MEGRHLLLLAVTPIALCAMGAFGLRVASDFSERLKEDSAVSLVEFGLNDASKLTPDHVRMVVRAARAIEDLGHRSDAGMATTIAGFARGCFGLAAVSALTIAVVARPQRRTPRDAG
jgi:hypothetical protein